MAFEKFTDRARKVVDLASTEAAQLGDTSVDTVHLLVGMLCEGSGVAGSVLASHNIDAEAVLKSCKSFSTDSDVTLPEHGASNLRGRTYHAQETPLIHAYPGFEQCLHLSAW